MHFGVSDANRCLNVAKLLNDNNDNCASPATVRGVGLFSYRYRNDGTSRQTSGDALVEHGCDVGGCDEGFPGLGCDPVSNGAWGGDNLECPEAEFMPAEVYVQEPAPQCSTTYGVVPQQGTNIQINSNSATGNGGYIAGVRVSITHCDDRDGVPAPFLSDVGDSLPSAGLVGD